MAKAVNTHEKTLRMVQIAFLAALVAVLQVISIYFKVGTIPLSLVLIPIMIGGAMYGVGAGAFLGGVFGLVTVICGVSGLDAGTLALIQLNAFETILIAMLKAIIAGAASALVYKFVRRIAKKSPIPASIFAAVTTPVVNSAIFCLGMIIFFDYTLFLVIPIILFNFLFEFGVNVVVCPILIGILSRSKRFKSIF